MSKALIIKSADFSVNAVERITVTDPVPCTGITLDKSALEITSIGLTGMLTATVTPADTTDSVTWTSSDISVATVEGGVVTTTGIGVATITATCGGFSATCTVTSRGILTGNTNVKGYYITGQNLVNGGDGRAGTAAYAIRGFMANTEGTLSLNTGIGDIMYYPIPLPANTARIKITYSDYANVRSHNVEYFSLTEPVSGYPTVSPYVTYQSDIVATDGVAILTIPTLDDTYPPIDAVIFNFKSTRSGDNTFLDSDFDTITIEFLSAE